MPSAVCTPRPWTNSCSANSPSFSSCAISSVTSSPAVTTWSATTSFSPELERAVEVGEADAVVARLAREDEAVDLALVVLGVEDHDLVAVGGGREVAELRARVQVGLLAPHALQARLEVLAHELAPGVALDAAPAPVELEQHVRVEVRVDLVERHLDLAHAPPRRRRHGRVGARGRAHGGVGRRRAGVDDDRLLAQRLRPPRASSRRARARASSSTSWSIFARPSNASLQ